MNNKSTGRKKTVSGQGNGVFRRGTAISGVPVGKADAYIGRKAQPKKTKQVRKP